MNYIIPFQNTLSPNKVNNAACRILPSKGFVKSPLKSIFGVDVLLLLDDQNAIPGNFVPLMEPQNQQSKLICYFRWSYLLLNETQKRMTSFTENSQFIAYFISLNKLVALNYPKTVFMLYGAVTFEQWLPLIFITRGGKTEMRLTWIACSMLY
jgi:hypothetical protein